MEERLKKKYILTIFLHAVSSVASGGHGRLCSSHITECWERNASLNFPPRVIVDTPKLLALNKQCSVIREQARKQ
jgi:hypothetical protein